MKKLDANDLAVEISGVAAIAWGLSLRFSGDGNRMTDECMDNAMMGISRYLERIADDVGELQ